VRAVINRAALWTVLMPMAALLGNCILLLFQESAAIPQEYSRFLRLLAGYAPRT
jgi:hypothetical protein